MKNARFLLFGLLLSLLGSVTFVACDDDDDDDDNDQNIVEFAQNDPNFSILVDALVKADLVDILSGDGPFTVFAPTNAAFQTFLDAIGTNTIENTPEAALVEVLTNHVLAGEFQSGSLTNGYATTLSETGFGQGVNTILYINTDSGVTLNGVANVVDADNDVSNGVIHAIDAVIASPTVVTFATADPSFSSLVTALTDPRLSDEDLVGTLNGDGPFTVFAPTNAAFQALLDSNADWNAISDIPEDLLLQVLTYHVVSGANVRSGDLIDGQSVTTLSGETFTIQLGGSQPVIDAIGNSANIIFTDVQAQNGVVHVVDAVLLPVN